MIARISNPAEVKKIGSKIKLRTAIWMTLLNFVDCWIFMNLFRFFF
jgi:hypothetical protein